MTEVPLRFWVGPRSRHESATIEKAGCSLVWRRAAEILLMRVWRGHLGGKPSFAVFQRTGRGARTSRQEYRSEFKTD
jgi:hypothetical protein